MFPLDIFAQKLIHHLLKSGLCNSDPYNTLVNIYINEHICVFVLFFRLCGCSWGADQPAKGTLRWATVLFEKTSRLPSAKPRRPRLWRRAEEPNLARDHSRHRLGEAGLPLWRDGGWGVQAEIAVQLSDLWAKPQEEQQDHRARTGAA